MNGWQLAPLLSYSTGLPFNPLTGTDNSRTGIQLDRPNATGASPYSRLPRSSQKYQYLNSSAYVANPIGTFGNAGHDSLRPPPYVDVDTAVNRTINLHENLKFDMRFEAFNVLNHPSFNAPSATLSSTTTFGQITTSTAPRLLQAALKLTF